MRYCPICKRCYDDTETRCVTDGLYLIEAFPGSHIVSDKYRVESLLGQGGMGSVYRATHLELDRTIALKIVLPDFVSNTETMERFRQEARAAARLNHPNVISVYDFGVLPTGQAYLAMELLTGHSLRAELERDLSLSPKRILEIMRPVCQAVDAAHRAGVIHRDLKPDNIVIERNDHGEEHIKVVDFGIAKLREKSGARQSNLTEPGLVMGTPHYMSPEQCRGEDLDACSDIYSLGVTAYEMLVGHVPFDAPTPSAVIVQHAIDPPPPLRRLRPDLPEEIERVVLRALSKRRTDRQQLAMEFYAELESAIANASATDAVSLAQPFPAPPPIDLLKDARHKSPGPNGTTGAVKTRFHLEATLAGHEHVVKSLAFHNSGGPLASASGDGTVRLWDVVTGVEKGTLIGHEYSVNGVAISPDGLRIASAGADGTVRLWSVRGEREIASFGHRMAVRGLAFTPDGRWLISTCDSEIKVWDAVRLRQITSFVGHTKTVDAIAVSADGLTLASGGADDAIRLWNLVSKTESAALLRLGHAPTALAFFQGGFLASGGRDRAICLWDVAQPAAPRRILEQHDEAVRALAVSPDDRRLASGDWNGSLRLWDLATGAPIAECQAHDGPAFTLAFSPDGRSLASGGADALVKLWTFA